MAQPLLLSFPTAAISFMLSTWSMHSEFIFEQSENDLSQAFSQRRHKAGSGWLPA